jgi:fucose 4-O-acetylase-like acetyltransferase
MSSGIAPATRDASPPERQVWIDLARGIGVILVVFGHMLGGLIDAHLFPSGPVASWTSYAIYTFHMPLFFYLSALNVRSSLSRRGPRAFLVSKVWTIVYPYFLWSLLQGGSIMLIGRDANAPVTAGMLLTIWYRPIAQFWFLYALMICHVLAVVIADRRVLLVMAVLGLAVFEYQMGQPGLSLVLHDLPAYVLGLSPLRAASVDRQGPLVTRMSIVWLALVWLGFAASVALGGMAGMNPQDIASLPACVTGIAGIVMLCRCLAARAPRWLATVGTMSMTIYVMHILAGAGTRIVLYRLHIDLGPFGYLAACTAAGVGLPMLAHTVLQRWHLLAAFGLGSSRLTRQPQADQIKAGSHEPLPPWHAGCKDDNGMTDSPGAVRKVLR